VYLDLVSPTGVQYVLYRLPGGSNALGEHPNVAAWSGDGSRVSIVIRKNTSETIDTLALRTGTLLGSFSESASVLQSPYQDAGPRFTFPSGTELLSQRGSRLVRTTFAGAVQASFPASFSRVHAWDAAWIESGGGTQLALGATNGIAIVNNNGTVAATLPVAGATQCAPVQWWSSVVLASCFGAGTRTLGPSLYEFSPGWAGPRRLTSPPTPPDYGDANAWRMAGKTFVQVLASCGPPHLGVLHGHRPSLIYPPGVNTAQVIGTTSRSLALASSDCVSGPTVAWYTPATNSSQRVLGPSMLGGFLTAVVAFPTETDQGLAYTR
jgi:TolB protein